MAFSTVQTTKIIRLELSEKEATWLKDTIQNAYDANEDKDSASIRGAIFDALRDALLK